MILNHINHKMPIFKDCTLGEMLFVGALIFVINGTIFSMITRILFGYAFIGLALTLLSLVTVTRILLGRLQKIKYGKPYGYYQQLFIKKIQKFTLLQMLMKSPFVERNGKWSVRRTW